MCFFFLLLRPRPSSSLFPYTTLFRSRYRSCSSSLIRLVSHWDKPMSVANSKATLRSIIPDVLPRPKTPPGDRKSTRLNSSHVAISYAVFCLKKKNNNDTIHFKKQHTQ